MLEKKAGHSGSDSMLDKTVKSSGPSSVTNGSLQAEASDCKSHKKPKKKLLRRQVPNMNFRSSMFLRASLAVRKKKKHKKSKLLPSDSKNRSKEIPSDLGPSTSEKTPTSPRKQAKSGARKKSNGTATAKDGNSCDDSLKKAVDRELTKRIGQNCPVLATDGQLQNGTGLSLNQTSRETTSSEREKMQNGWMDVLTRGLSETVGKWFTEDYFFFSPFINCRGISFMSL